MELHSATHTPPLRFPLPAPRLLTREGSEPRAAAGVAESQGVREETRSVLHAARAQFEVNYRAISSVRTEEGEVIRELSFSVRGSVELLHESAAGSDEELEALADLDPLERLREFFSPERTADRIVRFALAGYDGPDDEASRARYAEQIGAAIKAGVAEARELLGALPEQTEAEIDQTESLVEQRLEDFVKLGAPAFDPEEKERILSFSASLSVELSRTTQVTLYDARGLANDPAATARFAAFA